MQLVKKGEREKANIRTTETVLLNRELNLNAQVCRNWLGILYCIRRGNIVACYLLNNLSVVVCDQTRVAYFCVNQCWMKNVLSDGAIIVSVTGVERAGKGKREARDEGARWGRTPRALSLPSHRGWGYYAKANNTLREQRNSSYLHIMPSPIMYCNHIKSLNLLRYFHTIS